MSHSPSTPKPPRRLRAEPDLALGAELGEGARWDERAELLRFLDRGAERIHTYDPRSGELRTREPGIEVAAVAWSEDGREVGASAAGFVRIEQAAVPLGPPLLDGVEERLNDGRCDRCGRFWAGTSASGDRAGKGALYRLDGFEAEPRRLHGGVMMGNGIGWSPDDATMYFVDSLRRRVDAFRFDLSSGEIGPSRPLVALPADDALPDGLAVDVAGGVWVAMWGSGEVRRYTPRGRLDTIVEIAAANATSCALTPHGLFVTSAATEDERFPHAGDLFLVEVGVESLDEARFTP